MAPQKTKRQILDMFTLMSKEEFDRSKNEYEQMPEYKKMEELKILVDKAAMEDRELSTDQVMIFLISSMAQVLV